MHVRMGRGDSAPLLPTHCRRGIAITPRTHTHTHRPQAHTLQTCRDQTQTQTTAGTTRQGGPVADESRLTHVGFAMFNQDFTPSSSRLKKFSGAFFIRNGRSRSRKEPAKLQKGLPGPDHRCGTIVPPDWLTASCFKLFNVVSVLIQSLLFSPSCPSSSTDLVGIRSRVE